MNNLKKSTLRIDKLSIGLWVIFFGVFRPEVLPNSIQIEFRASCLVVGLLFLILYMNIRQLFNASLLYIIPIVLSCFINYYRERLSFANLINGIQYALCIYELYLVMELFVDKRKKDVLIKNLCVLSGLYCLASIATIIIQEDNMTYFLGSKYMTSYMMMFYLGIKYYADEVRIRKEIAPRIMYITLLIVFEMVIWYINCMTCFVAVFLMILIAFVPDRIKEWLSNPWVIVGILIGSLVIIFFITSILEIRVIQYLIQNLLHKNLTLTDRVRYYDRALDVFGKGDFWFGYGYASDEMRRTIALGTNIQNGLFQEILNYGIIGSSMIVVLVFMFTKHAHKDPVHNWPLFVLIIGFFVTAIAEISLNRIFFMSLFAIRWLSKQPEDANHYLNSIKRRGSDL